MSRSILLALWLAALGPTVTAAMDFSILPMPDGFRLVSADGNIVAGDPERFRVALQSAERDPFGNKNVFLNSGGGLVREAFEIVALMDQVKVTTIVPPGGMCASACAQIIFLSGVHRIVRDGGRLGMHSCSIGENRIRSPLCNDEIAKNALVHGTEYGSVMAFMRSSGPSEMMWFDSRDADCWGFTRWPPGFGRGIKQGDIAPCVRRAIMDATHEPAQ
jgi:hypothetical protein